MRPKESTHPCRRGFTLIELLVVVAIIALLVAILIPALGKSRDQAKTTACLANLHGIGVGTASYVADNSGYFFPSTIDWFNKTGQLGLQDILVQYVSTSTDLTTTRGKVYFCPSAINPNAGTQSQYPMTYDANMGVHIRMTPATVNKVSVMPPLARISQMSRTSEIIAIGDAAQATNIVDTAGQGYFDNTGVQWGSNWVAAPSSGDLPLGVGVNNSQQANQVAFGINPYNTDLQSNGYHPRYRHNGNTVANFVMADGHGESFKYNTVLNRNFGTTY